VLGLVSGVEEHHHVLVMVEHLLLESLAHYYLNWSPILRRWLLTPMVRLHVLRKEV
jgi:hypothetical protein